MAFALVLLDIQKGILTSDALKFEDPDMPKAVLRAADSMLVAARSAAVLVVHVGVARPRHRGAFDELRTANAKKAHKASRDLIALAQGTTEVEFLLLPASGDEVIYKVGVSAFEGTRLDQLLRNARVSQVVVAGAFTHMAVESTVRQGFDLGYHMIVAQDACCAPVLTSHKNSLATGIPNFALVMDSAEVIVELQHKATIAALRR